MARHELAGVIASAGFESGDRFVVGHWQRSPLGPMTDVMWAQPDDRRVLLVDRAEAAEFITAVYGFDHVDVVPIRADSDGASLEVKAGDVDLTIRAGPGWRLPMARLRPAWFTRWVEGPVARALLGVRTFGTSASGVKEWYRATEYRPVVEARASVGGIDLGALLPAIGTVGFGFTGPPRRPSMVRVSPLLLDRTGRLDRLLDSLRPADRRAPGP
jgi:hypothetical protein